MDNSDDGKVARSPIGQVIRISGQRRYRFVSVKVGKSRLDLHPNEKSCRGTALNDLDESVDPHICMHKFSKNLTGLSTNALDGSNTQPCCMEV
jgi:hypothetical protein